MPKCRDCGKEIIFVQGKTGRWIPCDCGYVQYEKGWGRETVITPKGDTVKKCTVYGIEYKGVVDGKGRIPHWATCPAREERQRAENEKRYREYLSAEKARLAAEKTKPEKTPKPQKVDDGAQLSFAGGL